ncbi:LuxR C-terminal-related transcriptional regulator [Bradyrhizobium valentinum]|uniref:LuxR C-terminal-related transcriptional regulator n=1 Tax=Bradyrhizobium valentinum TaxID=1518501 RepID=UPI00070E1E6F|nr:response regulator transcription factor [Bradyrhizobium valentinum]KRQ97129.1 two-component system response regulator [Bradyrhizobium valentinum]
MRSITVVIADRHPVVLKGLSNVLGAHSDFKIVASFTDGPGCVEAIRNLAPDIAILDGSMPGVSGPEILSIVNTENPSTRFVFFTSSEVESELVMSAAADGYSFISKEVEPGILVQFLRHVARGRRLLPLPTADQAAFREQSALTENAVAVLTDRERQIMRLVSEGLSNKEIGRRLNLSNGTIKVHLHHIFQKLEISNRTVLAAIAISQDDGANVYPEHKSSRIRRG